MNSSTLFITVISILFLLGVISLSGCGENGLTPSSLSGYIQRGAYKSSMIAKKGDDSTEYLSLSTYKLSKMSKKDVKTLFRATGRLNIYTNDGLYHIKQTSGAQVNISEQLYQFIKQGFEYTNKTYKEGYGGIRINH
jgi:hypothetical protein